MNDRLITVTYSVRDELVADTIKLSLRAVGEAKKPRRKPKSSRATPCLA